MNESFKKKITSSIVGGALAGSLAVILLLHNAWGDERYELKPDSIRKEIRRLDTAITVTEKEIEYAESDQQKQKYASILSIYKREKEAYQLELRDQS